MIEGAIVDACDKCSNFGTKVDIGQESAYKAIKKTIKISELENPGLELIPEYGKMIVTVREDKGLTRYDLAKKINEKESVVKRLEEEGFEPDTGLVKKIESFLDIRLRETYEGVVLHRREKKRIDLTVGDVVEVS